MMLYDPKWGKPADLKANWSSLSQLIGWLETHRPDKRYCFMDTGGCLFHQYLTWCGFRDVNVGGYAFSHADGRADLGEVFKNIAAELPFTFGAALVRARAAVP